MDTRKIYWRWVPALVLAAFVGSSSLGTLTARADETDNFRLPLNTDMADLGDFLEAVHTLALEESVAELNAGIERALQVKDPDTRSKHLAQLHEPEALAQAVASRFGATVVETRNVRSALDTTWARQAYPGLMTAHRAVAMNIEAHFPLDLRALLMVVQSPTIKAYGVYFGMDKLTHFHHLGWSYYKMYRALLASGSGKEEAYRKVIEHHAHGGLLAEANLYGSIGTGVYSNGDMAANYVGFKFLLNLTEPVTLQGAERPPLAVRCGVFWRLSEQVRPRSGWFRPFITDHFNEALNPCCYDWTMRAGIRRTLRSSAAPIVNFYTHKDHRPADPAYYDKLEHELSTYYGEPYGHSGQFDKLMTIGNTCIPALHEPAAAQ